MRFYFKLISVAFFMWVFIFLSLGYGEISYEIIEEFEHGRINWSKRIVEAEGKGGASPKLSNTQETREKAMLKARQVVYRNLLETIKHLQVTELQKIGDMVGEKDMVLPALETLLNDAAVVKTDYLTDGSVEIKVQMDLDGALSQLILPGGIIKLESIHIGKEQRKSDPEVVYTGMIVDARGLPFKPAMSFKLVDEENQEIYGPKYASRECVGKWGFCEYTNQIDEVKTFKRLGSNPLMVKGINLISPGASKIVISDTDVSKIRSTVDHLVFLKECRVVIVLDGAPAEPESSE